MACMNSCHTCHFVSLEDESYCLVDASLLFSGRPAGYSLEFRGRG